MKRQLELGQANEELTTEPGFLPPPTMPEANHTTPTQFELEDELRVKSAEYWLKLGVADEALRELEALPENIWRGSRVLKLRVAALGMLRESGEINELALRK
jgi:hypothetical protein